MTSKNQETHTRIIIRDADDLKKKLTFVKRGIFRFLQKVVRLLDDLKNNLLHSVSVGNTYLLRHLQMLPKTCDKVCLKIPKT